LKIVPKLSYVKLFKPWNWVIGTGIYIEDVKKEIDALTKRLVLISICISILIAFILFYIFKQSLNIERKRIEAESDLHESKEKYRTLVEASTEGLLMLVDGKITFANSVISKITGFQTMELIDLSLNKIISENNSKDVFNLFMENEIIKEGQFEINLKKKSGGFNEVLITSSKSKLYDRIVNILIVKDIRIDREQIYSNLNYQKLFSILNFGFFKLRIDSKGKFIYANDPAIRIFGFDSFNELAEENLIRLFADASDIKSIRKRLIADGYIKNKVIKINNKSKSGTVVAVSLVLFSDENSEFLICDGIIEDITSQENEKLRTNNLITDLKSGNYLIEQSVKDFILPYYSIDANSTIANSIEILSKRKTDSLLLTKDGKDYIGIITNSDIQKRVLTLNLKLDNPVYLIMSAPILYITEDTPVIDAITICEEKNINHLVVRNHINDVLGIFSLAQIYKNLAHSLTFFTDKVIKSETIDEFKQCYKSLLIFIKPLIISDISIKHVTNITSAFTDSIIKRIIELSIKEVGEPPVRFSFICLGSEGRKEESLFTDQDNAIIYEDVPNGNKAMVSSYFIKLAELVCNSLNQVAYSFCKGNVMAKNPQWNKSVTEWERYFINWIKAPEPQNLLDATIFFDFRNVYGEDGFAEHLRKTIGTMVPNQPVFLYHLASNLCNTKIQQISSASIPTDKNAEIIDLKSIISHIIMFARTYALQNDIWATNTIERLNGLKSKQVVDKEMLDELIFAYNFLMKLRFKNQLIQLENNLPLSNVLNTKELLEIELLILKKVLSKIQDYHNKISIDFRLNA
jgi:PAS domain S-box-containing protein